MNSDPVTWTAVVIAAFAALTGAVSTVVGYLSTRDKLRFDVKNALQDSEIASLKQAHEKCEDDHQEAREQITILHGKIDELQRPKSP